ncbi:Magnesium and cobalt efflux protein CorC [Mucisphaera calidilacus]|uniref:Magnesium and cobalt efflux protein CorC n=2 Tax=Mucisphaera calidilacus TaxID=2527982 RepID=A0A518BZ96_9BACT|nr:Magnesium and cobalt efflux protein CorC [Mucisphaera calidilacus]
MVITTLAGTYISACNVALKTFSRRRLEERLEEQGRTAWLALPKRLPHLQVMTGMLRVSLSLIMLLATLELFRLAGYDSWVAYASAFVVAGTLLSVFSVAIATSWGRYTPEGLISASIPILSTLYFLLWPVVRPLHAFDMVIRRMSGVDLEPDDDTISEDILSVVEEHEQGDSVNDLQKEMLEAVFELPSTAAGEIMTPRTDIKGIDITDSTTLEQVRDEMVDIGFSRVPVYNENLDQIVGMLYARDLIQFLGKPNGFDLRTLLRDPYLIPESKSVSDLLAEFQHTNQHMAIVLDEYGGTAGLITIEDILEEIVGEIRDEYEEDAEPDPTIRRISDNTVEIDARVAIDDINDELELELPEDDDFDTLGGFVLSQLGRIPKVDDTFEHETLRFTVTAAEKTRVVRIRMENLDDTFAGDDDETAG